MMATTGIIASMQVSRSKQNGLEKGLESLRKNAQSTEVTATIEKQSGVTEDYFEQAAAVLEAVEESV